MALDKARDDQEKLMKTMETLRLLTEKAEQIKSQMNGVVEESGSRIQGYERIFGSSKGYIDEFNPDTDSNDDDSNNDDDDDDTK